MSERDLGGAWRYSLNDSPDFARPELDISGWEEMLLPRNWFLDGLDHHGVVWFRREFELSLAPGEYATLRFDGVDYCADVYLNGRALGRHEGYFEAFDFDVTDAVCDGRNTLAVRVDSPFEPVGLDGWHMRKRLIKGVLNHHDCRPGGGWVAGGQAYNTGGIWNRVTLHVHGPVTLDRVLLRADLASDPPRLLGELTLTNRAGAVSAPLAIAVVPDAGAAAPGYAGETTLALPPGTSRHAFSLPVPDVQLWQPWDRGLPHLYRVGLDCEALGLHSTTTFGFRTVAVDANYRWTVNGQPYFPRGTNYIATQWLSEALFPEVAAADRHPFPPPDGFVAPAGESWFERDVRLLRAANLNLVRVHAHVLPGEFHDACDRAGLLVWQDFPFQWGYSDDPAFHDEAERQVRAMVAQLGNHPSIVAWCVHNESPWDAEWMAGEAGGSYDPAHNRALDARLATVVKALDPTRHVQLNSGTGDGHVYPGWYYGHWRDYAGGEHGAPFPTEYGAQALPAIATTQHMFARFGDDAGHAALTRFKAWIDTQPQWALAKDMPPLSAVPAELHDAYEVWEAWRFHDFQPPETFYRAGVELGDSLAAFIVSSQRYQDQIIRFATETYRQHKGETINGTLQFMAVDPWPSITWSVLDYWRQPKPGYAVLQQVMQPVLVTALLPPVIRAGAGWSLAVMVVNDLLRAFPDAAGRWAIVTGPGLPLDEGDLRFDVPPNGRTGALGVSVRPLDRGDYQLELSLRSDAELLSHNTIPFQVRP